MKNEMKAEEVKMAVEAQATECQNASTLNTVKKSILLLVLFCGFISSATDNPFSGMNDSWAVRQSERWEKNQKKYQEYLRWKKEHHEMRRNPNHPVLQNDRMMLYAMLDQIWNNYQQTYIQVLQTKGYEAAEQFSLWHDQQLFRANPLIANAMAPLKFNFRKAVLMQLMIQQQQGDNGILPLDY